MPICKVIVVAAILTSAGGPATSAAAEPANNISGRMPASPLPFQSCPPGQDHETPGCVEHPDQDSAGAMARCRDGNYSHSQTRSGTCSGHHGVAQWCPCGSVSSESKVETTYDLGLRN